ncbi:flagellar hook-basal body complex protein FliE [Pseudidiomarina sp.]|uniref:flagellar hook-basal body complex protein FliE n=1 Tax=Pseudidiomarina sp. TaxID=2081707 RepID=UPI00299D0840|nr:flagellar hook-basal body complex protein FliE [Pseudidiomarina sp.]MDX1705754.1 flagellar hook-basal body complex protein FliE [Pseudidiomarina sp.]
MSVPAIQTALQQMQALQTEVKAQPAATGPVQSGGFAQELKSSIDKINALQQISGEKTRAFQLGDPNVTLNEVMVDKQKASLAFEMGVQVRNRMVSAYKEIMGMQV